MKTKFFTLDFINKEIKGSERAFNRAGRGFNEEYTELTTLINERPTFKLVVTEPEKKKTSYEGMDRDFIRDFVTFNDPDRLPEFEAVNKNSKFPTVRHWFLDLYKKDGEKFNVKEEKKKIRQLKTKDTINNARKTIVVKVNSNEQKKFA